MEIRKACEGDKKKIEVEMDQLKQRNTEMEQELVRLRLSSQELSALKRSGMNINEKESIC